MKKNLRIVSAAAAALLAVAPVAASAVSTVSAADTAVTTGTQLGKVPAFSNNATVNVKPNVTLNTSVPGTSLQTALSASFEATVDGTTATATLEPGVSSIQLFKGTAEAKNEVTDLKDVTNGDAGATYKVQMNKVSLNFGTQNANKKVTLTFPKDDHFGYTVNGTVVDKNSQEVQLNQSGVVTLDYVVFATTAKDFANPALVNWRDRQTGATVTSGNIELYSGSNAGKMNVAQVISAVEAKYYAENTVRPQSSTISYSNNLKDALKAMNVDVDAQGWFVAPKSFTFNLTATANNNDAASSLAVTVNVPDGKEVTPSTVDSVSKRIMHNAYYYDKDAKRVGTDSVKRYNSVSVLPNTTTINGKAYYQVVENGKAVDKYINAANIDGTKRTLKHNAYVYASSKKRANKVVLKKGEVVTTYGASYTFKNGQKYYKIGDNTDKTYVKVANFR